MILVNVVGLKNKTYLYFGLLLYLSSPLILKSADLRVELEMSMDLSLGLELSNGVLGLVRSIELLL